MPEDITKHEELNLTNEQDEYRLVVAHFRRATAATRPWGRCCRSTFGHDRVPHCCWQLMQGAPLEFTEREKALLGWPSALTLLRWPSILWSGTDLNREHWSQEELKEALHDGILANTLECASHPTRPVLDDSDRVTAVVAVPDCNTDLLAGTIPQKAWVTLWQVAVDLVGPKAYYRHQRSDLVLL